MQGAGRNGVGSLRNQLYQALQIVVLKQPCRFASPPGLMVNIPARHLLLAINKSSVLPEHSFCELNF
jgi:hypothetical protein